MIFHVLILLYSAYKRFYIYSLENLKIKTNSINIHTQAYIH